LKFIPNTGHKAKELFDAVTDYLQSEGLSIEDCRGQSYDNASNMSGAYTGLQVRMKELNNKIEFIPCSASLNLVGENAAESCSEACKFFLLLQHLFNFFSASTSRWDILQKSMEKGSTSSTLKNLSSTRWSARDDACKTLKNQWTSVLDALNSIEMDSSQKSITRTEARGIISNLERLETAFMTQFWGFILERLNSTNKKLQEVNIDLSSVIELYDSLITLCETNRNSFDYFEDKAKELTSVNTYDFEQKRTKRRKLHYDEVRDTSSEFLMTGREHFRNDTFLVIIDTLIAELGKRRNAYVDINTKFKCIIQIQKLSLDDLRKAGEYLQSQYPEDIEETIIDELVHLKSHLMNVDPRITPTNPFF